MSRATELAAAEAARAEAEQDDHTTEPADATTPAEPDDGDATPGTPQPPAPPDDDDENEPAEPPAPPSSSGEPTKAQLRTLDREYDRHAKRLGEIMGEDFALLEPCDTCNGLGYAPAGPAPKPHEYFRECPTCVGFGVVLTGSRREGQELRDCPECGGRGYVEAMDSTGTALAELAQRPTAPAAVPPAPVALADANGGQQAAGEESREVRFGTPAWMGDPSLSRG